MSDYFILGTYLHVPEVVSPSLKTVKIHQSWGVTISFRQEGDTIPDHAQIRYYISSEDVTAEGFAQAVRQHWHIENKLYWSMDVAFK